jgi:hypothetical protein
MRTLRLAITALLLLPGLSSAPAVAQHVRGTARSAATEVPLEGVLVVLLDSAGSVVQHRRTDVLGRFSFGSGTAGAFSLRLSLAGYDDVQTATLRPSRDTTITVDMIAQVFRARPLDVSATARSRRLDTLGFYDRREKGFGSFITREQIESAMPILLTDVMRGIPGAKVVRAGAHDDSFDVIMPGATTMFFRNGRTPCYPSIMIDGVVARRGGQGEAGGWVHLVPPANVEAIEIYTRSAGLPPQVAGQTSPCGSIVIWLRR